MLSRMKPRYRNGFNGKEIDSNGEWGSKSHNDYGFRVYKTGVGKNYYYLEPDKNLWLLYPFHPEKTPSFPGVKNPHLLIL